VYLIVIGTLLVRRKMEGVLLSVLFAAITMAVAAWAILGAGSAESDVGLVALPTVGAIAGFIGLMFGRWRARRDALRRVLAWGSMAVLLFYLYSTLRAGIDVRGDTHTVRRESVAFSLELARAKREIQRGIAQHRRAQGAYLDSLLRARMADRALVMSALEKDSVSPGILDTLANSSDSTIVLKVIRNSGTGAATLTRIYRTHPSSSYYYPALASNAHTPKDVLNELATNTRDPWVIHSMLLNPTIDCDVLTRLEATLQGIPQQTNSPAAYDVTIAKEIRPKIC
jgi:hypothetical protein